MQSTKSKAVSTRRCRICREVRIPHSKTICEGCKKKRKIERARDERHLVHCEACRNQLNPLRQPWFAGKCKNCWPSCSQAEYEQKWRLLMRVWRGSC